jgi:chemotaxis protein histidine kinase CheA
VFTKAEWLTVLMLSTLWHFHEARKLAIQHLDGHNLTEMELIEVGRATSISRWVLAGFKSIAGRPQGCVISNEEANAIGHQAAHKVWTIRYQLAVAGDELDLSEDFIERELRSKFSEELAALKATELEHRTKADIERAEREEEERRKQEEEAKAVAEREQLAREEAMRWEAEREERERRAEKDRLAQAMLLEQERLRAEERIREEEVRLERERIERMRIEEESIQKELAELERQEREAKEAEEKRQREKEERLRRRQEIRERERREREEEEERRQLQEIEEKREPEGRARLEKEMPVMAKEPRRQEVDEDAKRGNEAKGRQEREERERQGKPNLSGFGSLWGGKSTSFTSSLFDAASPQKEVTNGGHEPFGWGGSGGVGAIKKTPSTSPLKRPSRHADQSVWGYSRPDSPGGLVIGSQGGSNSESPTTPLFDEAITPYGTSPSVPSPALETPVAAPDFPDPEPIATDRGVSNLERSKMKKAARRKAIKTKALAEAEAAAEELGLSPSFEVDAF